ncbi:MAG: hypothetical protein ACKVQR_08500 [Aquabacterium sp.]
MDVLAQAWQARRAALYQACMAELAAGLLRLARARVEIDEPRTLALRWQQLGAAMGRGRGDALGQAEAALAALADDEMRVSTTRLLTFHGLDGQAQGLILERVAGLVAVHARLSEGRAALIGGALTGALAGLKADLVTGGLTLGGGMLAGGLLGALGAAGLARGINVTRGTGRGWVSLADAARLPVAQAALLRYLAVAHFGRGRGDWQDAEAPAHWPGVVAAALVPRGDALIAALGRAPDTDAAGQPDAAAAAVERLLTDTMDEVFALLYPGGPTVVSPPANP